MDNNSSQRARDRNPCLPLCFLKPTSPAAISLNEWLLRSPSCSVMSCAMLSHFCRVRLFVTPQTVARQSSLFMGFSRQEYWSGLPFSPPGESSQPGIKPASLSSPALEDRFFTTRATWEAPKHTCFVLKMLLCII